MTDPRDLDDWIADDWEAARQRSFVRGSSVSPAERVAWLEEMIRVAWSSGALPRPRDAFGQLIDPTVPPHEPPE
ncbi:MAG TPA: hypothetical protein VGP07_26910 [Polyangia bacterium]